MLIDHFPLLGLRLRTPRLELRLPQPEELAALAEVAAAGVHKPDFMPFVTPWTRLPKDELCRFAVQSHWSTLGRWKPADWSLNLTVFRDGAPIGTQIIRSEDFGVTRTVVTSSWLGLPYQRRGFGIEMRAAVLDLAFTGLGALEAASTGFADNTASGAVSARLGYRPNGLERVAADGDLRVDQHYLLTRADWQRNRTIDVAIDGLEPCLTMFGVPAG